MKETVSREIQDSIETLFSKYQLLPTLREVFEAIVPEENYPDDEDREFILDALSQIYLHKRADPSTMVGILSPKHGSPQEVADKLTQLIELGFVNYDEAWDNFIVVYGVSKDIEAMLARYQYPLPMVIAPNPIKTNYQTGYNTIKGSVVLNDDSDLSKKDFCLDHLNMVNAVPLSFDLKVIESDEAVFSKPERNIGESFPRFMRRAAQAKSFYETSMDVMKGLLAVSEVFYLTHKYDRRGRCYASGYRVTTQGTDYQKAVVVLANKELIKGDR